MSKIEAINNENIRKRPRKKWKIIVLCALGAFILAVGVLAVANLSVLRLVFSPENIVISEQEETITVLESLESAGSIRNLEISDDASSVSFSNANEGIKISSEYDGGRLRRINGDIDTRRVGVSTVEEGRELAGVMLSPYFTNDEIAAILLRYSPEIIAGAGSSDINLSFDIGGNYHVTVTGSARGMVEFSITTQ